MTDPLCKVCQGVCVHGEQSPSPEDLELARLRARVAELEQTLGWVQRLPELEWAQVAAGLMMRFASVSRAGFQTDAKAMADILDRGKTFVSRLEAECDRLRAELDNLKRERTKERGSAATSLIVAVLDERDACAALVAGQIASAPDNSWALCAETCAEAIRSRK